MPLRHGVQYASTTGKRVPMFDDVAAYKVAEHIAAFYPQPFTVAEALALIEARCGRYIRGAHKGQLRGWATLEVVREGGWKRYGPGEGNGRVVRPGRILSISIGDDFSGKTYLEVR
jgi:hypothetical protein